MWDEIKIGAHDFAVDAKTKMQNLCTDMYYGAANLGVAMQKGVLAMDDAFQSVKGTVSQAVSDQFKANTGKLIVEAHELTEKIERINSMDLSDQFGGDDKSMHEAQAYKEEMVAKLKLEQEKLTEKIESREGWRDKFSRHEKDATQKMQGNQGKRDDLNAKAELNTGKRQATKTDRSAQASQKKSTYADKPFLPDDVPGVVVARAPSARGNPGNDQQNVNVEISMDHHGCCATS
ncbi:predicted protein [Trichoplax adhaerens]|uniref:Uncharacterized protein n=1 Tax=Trichoplax adhaerens TaxID=10228 RepID=B3SF43_TRIAD|nr:predicted protein [Trichoplax adhaerens]EDV18651.1 predicted protein [Trichoplax adhaerens]|eukprot:XP_002118862.1 predicted protein [Trichoplax adhaerens]